MAISGIFRLRSRNKLSIQVIKSECSSSSFKSKIIILLALALRLNLSKLEFSVLTYSDETPMLAFNSIEMLQDSRILLRRSM